MVAEILIGFMGAGGILNCDRNVSMDRIINTEIFQNLPTTNKFYLSKMKIDNPTKNILHLGGISGNFGENGINCYFWSPIGKDFNDYLQDTLQKYLEESALYNADSDIEISSEILNQQLNIPAIGVDGIYSKAKFVVQKQDKEIYVKTFENTYQFDTNPLTIGNEVSNNYPIALSKVIDMLFTDKEFLDVISK